MVVYTGIVLASCKHNNEHGPIQRSQTERVSESVTRQPESALDTLLIGKVGISEVINIGSLNNLPANGIDVGNVDGGSTSLTNLEQVSAEDIDANCPSTTLSYDLDPPIGRVELVLPKFLTLGSDIRVLLDEVGQERTIVLEDNGTPKTFRMLIGIGLACADKTYRPVLLSPTPPGFALNEGQSLFTFEPDHISHLCFRFRPDKDSPASWQCGKGYLADGVTGYAVKDGAPRTFWTRELKWKDSVWKYHFEFTPNGLGPIATRIPKPKKTGYTLDAAWGLNPRDHHARGVSKRSMLREYLAALALKTATNRNRVHISAYNHPNVTSDVAFDPDLLNQCEPTYQGRSLGVFDVYGPDVASTGKLQQGILIDIAVAPWYRNRHNGCDWAHVWNLHEAPTKTVQDCTVFELNSPMSQQHDLPILGVNLGLVNSMPQARRCPSWTPCPVGNPCCTKHIAVGSNQTCLVKTDGTVWCWGKGSKPAGRMVLAGNQLTSPVTTLSLSQSHECVLVEDGRVWCSAHHGHKERFEDMQPVEIAPGVPLTSVVEVTTSEIDSCARRTDGSVWCWGKTFQGDGQARSTHRYAVRVLGVGGVARLVSGRQHSCVLRLDGRVQCWGANNNGQLGNGTTEDLRIPGLAKLNQAAGLDAANDHTCAWKTDGTVWCWGSGTDSMLPTRIPMLADVKQVACYAKQNCALKQDGTVWCWGDGGHPAAINIPLSVQFLRLIESSGVGSDHFCLRQSNGRLWCWGENQYGQLTNGTTKNAAAPVESILQCN